MTTTRGILVIGVGVAIGVLASGPGPAQKSDHDELVAKGRTLYTVYCRSCHGTKARGDGPVAEVLKVPPTDLTTIAARNDGEYAADDVAAAIDGREEVAAHGSRDMPVWGDAFARIGGVEGEEEAPDEAEAKRRIRALVEWIATIQREE